MVKLLLSECCLIWWRYYLSGLRRSTRNLLAELPAVRKAIDTKRECPRVCDVVTASRKDPELSRAGCRFWSDGQRLFPNRAKIRGVGIANAVFLDNFRSGF